MTDIFPANLQHRSRKKLLVFSGPCQIENRDHTFRHAEYLKDICKNLPVDLIFKSSFDKANRTRVSGTRGIGLEKGLKILQDVRQQLELPIITDIHTPEQVPAVAEVVDVLQIPAFLCRQTDLLLEAGKSGKPLHLKKGQFLAPGDMQFALEKVTSTGNQRIFLCERGTTFGYHDLVVDFRGISIMKDMGYPVIFDATHSLQKPGGMNGSSGGNREFLLPLLRGALAAGVDGIFVECHENPNEAPSDGMCMVPLREMPELLRVATHYREAFLSDPTRT